MIERYYRLDDSNQVQPCSQLQWAEFMNTTGSRIAFDTVNGCCVSSVFLGLDHAWTGSLEPVLFEILVFTGRRGSWAFLDHAIWRFNDVGTTRLFHHNLCRLIKQKNLTELKRLTRQFLIAAEPLKLINTQTGQTEQHRNSSNGL